MKPLLISLILLFLTSNLAFTQTLKPITDNLIRSGLIDKKDVKLLESFLKGQYELSNSNILISLVQVEIYTLGIPPLSEQSTSFSTEDISNKEKESMALELRKFLDQLNGAGLLTTSIYSEYNLELLNGKIWPSKITFLIEIVGREAWLERFAPEKLRIYAEKLYQNNIVSDTNHKRLISDINNGKIDLDFPFIDYCNYARSFTLSAYSDDPAVYLEQIHREVSQIFPELSFTGFTYKIVVDSTWTSEDYTSYNVIVNLKCNGKTYKHKSFISLHDFVKDKSYLGKIDDQEFYNIFNKILTDNQSPYRLHKMEHLGIYAHKPSGYPRFGIIALKKEQTEMFRFSNPYLGVSYENFKNNLTTTRIEQAVEEWKKAGILNHLSESEIKSATSNALELDNQDLNDVLHSFRSVIHSFDVELGNVDDPYAELLGLFSDISHGVFNPTGISDNFSKPSGKKVKVKFNLNGKNYSLSLKYENDWIDITFFEMVNKAVIENNLPGKFYELYNGNYIAYIFLTPQQYEYLKTKKLLVFNEELETN